MQIIGSVQIVTVVTSVVPTFLSCIALFGFVSFAFRFLVLLALLECAGGFRLCGGDHGLCPLDSHKPLKRLDRNFKCFCAVTFVSLIGFCAMLRPRRLAIPGLTANLMPPPPKKIKKLRNITKAGCHKPKLRQPANHYFEKTKDLSSNRQRFLKNSPVQPL